jgi:hypothetical protein
VTAVSTGFRRARVGSLVVGARWGMVRSPAFTHAEEGTADPAPPA